MQRGVVAQLHAELGSTTERLQADLAEWQGRCEALEGQLQEQQQHAVKLEQDLKNRPSPQQVSYNELAYSWDLFTSLFVSC